MGAVLLVDVTDGKAAEQKVAELKADPSERAGCTACMVCSTAAFERSPAGRPACRGRHLAPLPLVPLSLCAPSVVDKVQPEYIRYASIVPGSGGNVTARATPNDPQYGSMWQWPMISAPAAWDITTGARSVGGEPAGCCACPAAAWCCALPAAACRCSWPSDPPARSSP